MGVVYRARDTRLQRIVALKALPPDLAADTAARERFEVEARLLAALEHPHVGAIYGIEEADGASYLVLQHVEGESLANRLRRGPLDIPDALDIARQIASGLSAAHRRGIVHCDLKPGNVMVTLDGTAKLVDFGIALRYRGGTADEVSSPSSSSGVAGTPAYMSPEQARGEAIDPRTDVWSFGCVLAECLGGAHPFGARGTAALARALSGDTPDWSLLPEATPPSIRSLLELCLVQDAAARLSSIDEARAELERALTALRGATQAAPGSTLPRSLTSFVGRERELAEVAEVLSRSRLVTLTGAAGCGKTRLAIEAATRASARFPDGTWFAALAPIADPAHVESSLVAAVGATGRAGLAPRAILTAHVGDRKALLLLDNCEHLLSEVSQVAAALVQACPRLVVLCTSREALGIAGEAAWRVPSLAHPSTRRPAEGADLASFDGIRLLAERAREARPSFVLDQDTAPVLAAIVERLDGIPLAIELAAARFRMLAPEQILERLADRFRLLTGGSRSALERHQTLRAALDWSYNLLSDDEKRCLCELSTFAGGFRLEEAARICTGDEFEVLDLVTALVDKSLVQAETEARQAPRYRLLESIRQHASMKLEESGAAADVRSRHRDCYAAFAITLSRESAQRDDGQLLRRLEVEHDNLRAALEWSLADPAGAGIGLQLGASLVGFWDATGGFAEAREWLQRLLGREGIPTGVRAWATAMKGLAAMEWWLGDLESSRVHAQQSVDAWLALGDRAGAATALGQLAMCDHSAGRLGAAREAYLAGAERARETGDVRLVASMLLNASIAARDEAALDDARRLAEEALELSQSRGGGQQAARALVMLGGLARDRGDLDEAWELTERGLHLHEARNERQNVASTLSSLGHVARLRGDDALAGELYTRAARACHDMGERRGESLAMANLAAMARRRGDLATASAAILESLVLARGVGARPLMASIVAELGADAAAAGRPRDAVRLIAAATAAREEMGRRLVGAEAVEMENVLRDLREKLGSDEYDLEWRRGASSGLEAEADAMLAAGPGEDPLGDDVLPH